MDKEKELGNTESHGGNGKEFLVTDPEGDLVPYREAREVIRSWAQIRYFLPENFDRGAERLLRDYFRGHLSYSKGKEVKGKRILIGLQKRAGYEEFEKKYESYLSAVGIRVRGFSTYSARPAFLAPGVEIQKKVFGTNTMGWEVIKK